MTGHVMDARDLSMSQRRAMLKKNPQKTIWSDYNETNWCEQLKYGWCDKDPFSKHQIQRIYSANAEVLQWNKPNSPCIFHSIAFVTWFSTFTKLKWGHIDVVWEMKHKQ
jgi:hypothetical protein